MDRIWQFRADMNGDWIVTVSDVWLWAKWLYFYPGDLVIAGVINYLPGLARFLEFGAESYGGMLSGFLSIVSWLILLVSAAEIAESAGRST